ncbi:hypothetical protein CB0940_06725 [Cercospora beticola]|uniref:Uncharacterized protein n=1 Tax=Cercospora beticola TaxID=122368 RepID=A0A2G5H9Q4_CERBT|nr:hypothetical protein CB0940_06725 [Cercospora beticola]PIA89259.1 hypothetical protein CB0940_06725 [Cercospora beticola]WPB02632.1 hypothetical protein RHO25_007268 [Cercospora beticola]
MASNTISHTVQAKSDEATDSSDGTISLRNSLEGLRQELYDEIYRLTFTADAKVRVYTDEPTNLRYAIAMEYAPHPIYGPGAPQHKHMTRDERPPANLMAVSRRSRLQFAKSFFGQDSIIVLCGEYGVRELYKFIAPEHMPLLRLYVSEIFGTDNGEKWTRMTLHYIHPSPPPERIFLSGLEKAVKLEFGFETNDPCSSNYPKPA